MIGGLAGLISVALLAVLAARDPKRLRNHPGLRGTTPHSKLRRRLLAYASVVPGVALIAYGELVAMTIWLGVVTTLGWLLVITLAPRSNQGADSAIADAPLDQTAP